MSDFVGLDPDGLRRLSQRAGDAAELAAHVAGGVATVAAMAEITATGAVTIADEIAAEMGSLADLCVQKAALMEGTEHGYHVSTAAMATLDDLWASLTDGVGEGLMPGEVDAAEGSVPVSASVAARTLASHLDEHGIEITTGPSGDFVQILLADPDVPPEVQAAAQFVHANLDVFQAAVEPVSWMVTPASLQQFADVNAALAVVAPIWMRLSGDDGRLVGDRLAEEMDYGTWLSDEQRAAIELLLTAPGTSMPRYDSGREWLTSQLVNRQVLGERPDLAAQWVWNARVDPGAWVDPSLWGDEGGVAAWVTAATTWSPDPADQTEIVVDLVAIAQATAPDSPLAIIHLFLDAAGIIDPTPIADGVNTSLYAAEGDMVGAATSGAAMGIPFVTGAMLRLAARQAVDLTQHTDEIVTSLRAGDVTRGQLDSIVDTARSTLGEHAGDQMRRQLDKLYSIQDQIDAFQPRISVQRQNRHLGTSDHYAGGGYFDSIEDAQQVLDAVRDGSATVIGRASRSGGIVVRVDDVTGYNVNSARQVHESTNVFVVKGTSQTSIFPASRSIPLETP